MSNDNQDYIARLEKSISQKYGDAAVDNPQRFWNAEKEKEYVAQAQEEQKKFAKFAETQDTVEQD